MIPQLSPGQRVRVATLQPTRLGKPTFPGRVGTVLRMNSLTFADRDPLWCVVLDATYRAKARTEPLWASVLVAELAS